MKHTKAIAVALISVSIVTLVSAVFSFCIDTKFSNPYPLSKLVNGKRISKTEGTIKWVEFNVPYYVMKRAMDIDIDTYGSATHINWIDILSYLGARYGGVFDNYRDSDMDHFVYEVKKGKSVSIITKDMEYFKYYNRAYGAVLNGFLGEYKIKLPQSKGTKGSWKSAYGLKAFSPIAEGYYYSDFDDFGRNRSYGYSRSHLGHDMMTSTGVPVIAVESGIVEALGWNQYGGWRIGIRSYDTERYYYYAHLMKDHPFSDELYVGCHVTAGDIIGFTGQTGYSITENTNNIDTPHLHLGMQLVFDEEAKDSPTQIWIDLYDIVRLLSSHRSSVIKNDDGTYSRRYPFVEENFFLKEKEASSSVSESKYVQVPIIMYHALLKHPVRQSRYIVNPDVFEKDLVYMKKKGYTPVFMRELIAFADGKGQLPDKPIVITFDDGYYNNYYYAMPLLEKYNMKAVISIVGKMTDDFTRTPDENPYYSHVTWDNIKDMEASGHWEIQNHSYNCHTNDSRKGVEKKSGESYGSYKAFLISDVSKLQNKISDNINRTPNTFTYPFGAYSEETDKILKNMGFRATLGCTEGVNTIENGDPRCLYRLKRCLRTPEESPEEFFDFL